MVTEDWYFLSHRLALAQAARAAGLQVMVATAPGRLGGTIRGLGFDFFPLRLRRNSMHPVRELLSIADLALLYRRTAPDLVHHVALKPVVYGSLAAKIARVPAFVNAITGLGYAFVDQGSNRALLRRGILLACAVALHTKHSGVIFQNPDDRELFIKNGLVSEAQSHIILGSGVDSTLFHPTDEPSGPVVILLPARMIWDKGVGELVQATRILMTRNLEFKVLLAGKIDHCNPASLEESQLRAWEAEGLISWLGHVEDMFSLYAKCHIVCLPSHYREGVPLSLIEAASCGRPIVSTDTVGCREIVKHNFNGILVPPKDPSALAEALQQMILDSSHRREMGRNGRDMVLKNFDKEVIVRQTLDVYRLLLGEKWPQ